MSFEPQHSQSMLTPTVGIPAERATDEIRVLLNPEAIRQLTAKCYKVCVESGAGEKVGIQDDEFRIAGAYVASQSEAWNADVVLKLKPPTPEEFCFFREGLILGAALHCESDLTLSKAMASCQITAYAFELFENSEAEHPWGFAGGVIAGKLAMLYAMYHLVNNDSPYARLLTETPGGQPGKVLIIGSGNVGRAAANFAAQLGCSVSVVSKSTEKAKSHKAKLHGSVNLITGCSHTVQQLALDADVIIGAILISDWNTPALIPRKIVRRMKPGSVIVDVTCGYGPGYLPSIEGLTTLAEPVRNIDDVIHIKIDNLPRATPRQSIDAISSEFTPYIAALLDSIRSGRTDQTSAAGLVIDRGRSSHSVLEGFKL